MGKSHKTVQRNVFICEQAPQPLCLRIILDGRHVCFRAFISVKVAILAVGIGWCQICDVLLSRE